MVLILSVFPAERALKGHLQKMEHENNIRSNKSSNRKERGGGNAGEV